MDRNGIVERELDTERDEPAAEIVEIVSELEGREFDDLTPLWACIDGLLEHVFADPPAPEAELVVSFDYEGYRITVDQDGRALFDGEE